jgi:hypothetical protein
MKTWLFAVVGATSLAALGCHTDPNIVALERELRQQEDRIYQLEDCLDQKEAELQACRKAAASGEKPPEVGGKGPAFPSDVAPPAHGNGTSSTSPGTGPTPPETGPAPLRPPVINLPGEAAPPGTIPGPFNIPSNEPSSRPGKTPETEPAGPSTSSTEAPPSTYGPPSLGPLYGTPPAGPPSRFGLGPRPAPSQSLLAPMEVIRPNASSAHVTHITLVRLLTGGYHATTKPDGDDGITVMIEPRDKKANIIDAPADVTVAVLDEALRAQGDAARVAKWDFTAKEIAGRFRRASVGRGIYLELPWTGKPPVHKNVLVYVEYHTSDHRKLTADQEIEVHLPGEQSWLPAPPSHVPSRADAPPPTPAPAPPVAQPERAVILSTPQVSNSAAPPAMLPAATSSEPATAAPVDSKPQANRPVWSPYR